MDHEKAIKRVNTHRNGDLVEEMILEDYIVPDIVKATKIEPQTICDFRKSPYMQKKYRKYHNYKTVFYPHGIAVHFKPEEHERMQKVKADHFKKDGQRKILKRGSGPPIGNDPVNKAVTEYLFHFFQGTG